MLYYRNADGHLRRINRDSLPHLFDSFWGMFRMRIDTFGGRLAARWWGVRLGPACLFFGRPYFRRYPGSRIAIGDKCRFRSSPTSNLIGINRPCIISTLIEGAEIEIGPNCGFSGTVISSAARIVFGENVRCGANTLITDTDWHTDDPRTGPNEPVVIESGVWLGVNVTVLKGVTIGKNTVVAAGSMVTKSLPAGVVAVGVPAKVLRKIDCGV